MHIIGYARVSTTDQDLSIQEEKLRAAGASIVFSEKRSGTTTANRAELDRVLEILRPGDTLLVTRLDRFGRSIADVSKMTKDLIEKGVTLKATDQQFDTGSASGRAFLNMLAVFAEFETEIRKERQLEGIAKAKAAGVYKGRPATIKDDDIRRLQAEGVGATEIAKRLKIGRASVYRVLKATQPAGADA